MISIILKYSFGKYNIKLESASDPSIFDKLQNIYQIEKYALSIRKEDISKGCPIEGILDIPITVYKNGGLTAKNKEYIILTNGKETYYLELSIDGTYKNDFVLCLSLGVFKKKNNKLSVFFEASSTIFNNIPINKLDDENNNFNNKPYFTVIQNQNHNKIPKNEPDLNFSKKEVNYIENQITYSISNIKNINELSKSISKKIFGFINLGNTCFLNSSLQILIHSTLFINNFLDDIKIIGISQDTVTYEFFNLIMEINSSNKKIFSPNKLISSFINKCNLFSLGQQSDSQRFYRNFLIILEKEIGPQNTCVRNTFVGTIENSNIYYCPDIFCKQKQKQNAIQQQYHDIVIPCQDKISLLEDLLKKTYELKFIKSSQKCAKCKNDLNFIRFAKIYPNDYIGFNIQSGEAQSRTLKSTLITIKIIKINEEVYEPYAINFHTGTSMDFGHYYR